MKNIIVCFFLLLSFAPANGSEVMGAPASETASSSGSSIALDNKEDWGKYFELCDRDWNAYDASLRNVREDLKKELLALPQKEYLARYGNDDPKIAFVSLNWPSDLQPKDKSWESYKDCADDNWTVRKSLSDASQNRKSRADKIEVLKNCLVAREPKSGLIFPYDRLLACYEKHAARP